MALMRCAECNKKISEQAVSCPKCGCPVAITNRKQQVKLNSAEIDEKRTKLASLGLSNLLDYDENGIVNKQAQVSPQAQPQQAKPEKKAKIPWFAVGMVANQLKDAQIRGRKQDQEQNRQSKILEATLKELKKR